MSDHHSILSGLYEDPDYADLTIKCEDGEVKLHKSIICRFSPVFAAATKDNWVEGRTNVVTLNEYDQATVSRMKQYVYLGIYAVSIDPQQDSLSQRNNAIVAHVKVFSIAHYYQNKALQDMAAEEIDVLLRMPACSSGFVNVIEVIQRSVPADHSITTSLQQHILEHSDQLLADDEIWKSLARNSRQQPFLAGLLLLAGKQTSDKLSAKDAQIEKATANTEQAKTRADLMMQKYSRARSHHAQDIAMMLNHLNACGPLCSGCQKRQWDYNIHNRGRGVWCKCGHHYLQTT